MSKISGSIRRIKHVVTVFSRLAKHYALTESLTWGGGRVMDSLRLMPQPTNYVASHSRRAQRLDDNEVSIAMRGRVVDLGRVGPGVFRGFREVTARGSLRSGRTRCHARPDHGGAPHRRVSPPTGGPLLQGSPPTGAPHTGCSLPWGSPPTGVPSHGAHRVSPPMGVPSHGGSPPTGPTGCPLPWGSPPMGGPLPTGGTRVFLGQRSITSLSPGMNGPGNHTRGWGISTGPPLTDCYTLVGHGAPF